MRRYLGVDPGVSGGYAILEIDEYFREQVAIRPTPVLWTAMNNAKRRRYNVTGLWAQLAALPPVTFAYLEQQMARPKQGVSSTFATGEGYGIWTALLTAAAIPFAIVPPARWRIEAHLPAHPKHTDKKLIKEAVRLAACRRFPHLVLKLDYADAVMLAVAASHGEGPRHVDAITDDPAPEPARGPADPEDPATLPTAPRARGGSIGPGGG
jgi:hypothetical protein